MMMKLKSSIACLLATLIAGICMASAQTSKTHSSSTKPNPDPVTSATKPLTPKSAMQPPRKTAAVVAGSTKSASKTSAELNHLERQPAHTANQKGTPAAKATPKAVTTDPAAANNSRTNFKYQKPAGGVQATRSEARAPNSQTPRVNKPN
jgi:hypothetical protein